jgi:hypothetical protein
LAVESPTEAVAVLLTNIGRYFLLRCTIIDAKGCIGHVSDTVLRFCRTHALHEASWAKALLSLRPCSPKFLCNVMGQD